MTVGLLIKKYLKWADGYYVKPSGRSTRHSESLRSAFKELSRWRTCRVDRFTHEHLDKYRQYLADRGVSRRVINQWTGWVRGMFRWAVRNRHVSPTVVVKLELLGALRYARSTAVELPRVRAVDRRTVAMTVSELPEPAALAVRLQWVTGMRSGEVLSMRWQDIERVGKLWLYRPREHKTEHYGCSRVVLLCPEAQRVLGRRQSRGWCIVNRMNRPYTPSSYSQAVRRACRRSGLDPWTPHQLRHAAATEIARKVGIDAARAILGHKSLSMTELYVEREETEVLQVAKALARAGWRRAP